MTRTEQLMRRTNNQIFWAMIAIINGFAVQDRGPLWVVSAVLMAIAALLVWLHTTKIYDKIETWAGSAPPKPKAGEPEAR